MARSRVKRAGGVYALLPVLVSLLIPAGAFAHEGGPPHHFGVEEHGDPNKALPATLITEPVAQDELTSLEPNSIDAASVPETWCGTETTTNNTANQVVSAGTPHYKLVYAYAGDQTNRFSQLKDRLQATVSLLQRYLAVQSDGKKALRWDMGTDCGPQYVDIQVVQLPQTRSYYVPGGAPDFTKVRDDVFSAIGGAGAPRNIAIYADGLRGTNGVAGTATIRLTDETTTTAHDSGGLGTVVWGAVTLTSGNYAEPAVMMHEIAHNLGAVQNSSPHSTLAGHCYDEWDVMCYADGGARGQGSNLVTNCGALAGDMDSTFDCGRDDYFNPNPAQDSYLDLKWNTYAVEHLGPCSSEFADACGLTGPAGDGTKPTNTTPIPATVWRNSWAPALSGTDTESAIDAYGWKIGVPGGSLSDIQRAQQAAITGEHAGQVNLHTRVRDGAGNWSQWRWDPVFIDTVEPTATVDCPDTWSTGSTAPMCSYTIDDVGSGERTSETQKGSNSVAAGGVAGTLNATADAQTIRVRGIDWAANTGEWASDTARWDRANPTATVTCPSEAGTGSTTCHVEASDAASGVDTVTWRVDDGSPTEVEPDSDISVTTPGEHTITVVATDVAGRTSQATATSHVAPSAAPSGTDTTVSTDEDSSYAFTAVSFGFSDPDSGDTLDTVRIDSLPTAGSLIASGVAVTAGSSYAPGTLTYTPAANACGAAYASFTFSVRDSAGTYDPTPNTVTLNVTCVDDAPVAVADVHAVGEDSWAIVDVRANDTDADGGAKTIVSQTGAAHGMTTIMADGSGIAYKPDVDYCGPDVFTYTLNGGSTTTVTISVACAPESLPATDRQPPETTIVDGPNRRVTTKRRRARVTFAFVSSEPKSAFLCRIDDGQFELCDAQKSYRLKPGRHTFRVRAIDAAGNADATPAKKRVGVVRVQPRRA